MKPLLLILSPWAPRWVAISISVLTLALAFYVNSSIRRDALIRFHLLIDEVTDRISSRIERYENALYQARALVTTYPEVTKKEFESYARNLNLIDEYPGIQGIGIIRRVPHHLLKKHEAEIRAEGHPDYDVWPEFPERTEYFPITYLEPLDWRNRRAVGYDMWSEATRRSAMQRARDSGTLVLSDRVTLVQEVRADAQKGFLMLVPVYEQGVTPATPLERSGALRGFVYSPFRSQDFFSALFGGVSADELKLNFTVYDGPSVDAAHVLYSLNSRDPETNSDQRSVFIRTDSIRTGDHIWTLRYQASPAFVSRLQMIIPWGITLAGLIIAVLIYRIMSSTRERVIDERRARARLEKVTQELSEAVASRDEFLSIASHELKTPLTSLLLQTQIYLRSIGEHPSRKLVQSIDRQAIRLGKLVDDMLNISRIQAGKLPIEPSEMNLTELAHEIADRFQAQAESLGSRISVSGRKEAWGTWDRHRLDQVISNLVSNALKYGQGKDINIKISQSSKETRLSVSDQGMGIPETHHERIFERFERIKGSSNVGGLGIGLYITKKIVELHSGKISVSSREGRGSTFTVALPNRPANRLAKDLGSSEGPPAFSRYSR